MKKVKKGIAKIVPKKTVKVFMHANQVGTPEGKLCIYPDIASGRFLRVNIFGDPQGLRYLAKQLINLADVNQEKIKDKGLPPGAREHYHLYPNTHMEDHSCEVVLWRADAKGTGEFPDFMK